jgi:hypothetical protein
MHPYRSFSMAIEDSVPQIKPCAYIGLSEEARHEDTAE